MTQKHAYTATYILADGTPCHIGSGNTFLETYRSALWSIEMDGLDDCKTIIISGEDGPITQMEVA